MEYTPSIGWGLPDHPVASLACSSVPWRRGAGRAGAKAQPFSERGSDAKRRSFSPRNCDRPRDGVAMQQPIIPLFSVKRCLLSFTVAMLVSSQVCCGGSCGGFVPCVPPSAILTPSTFELTFGNQTVGTASSPQTVTLSATGMASSLIDSIATSGDFSQTNNCGKAVAPNTSCAVMVVFMPTTTGTRTGRLVISQGPSVQIVVGLTGTGQ